MRPLPEIPAEELARWVADARSRTLALVEDLDDEQILGPRLAIVNPLLWEIGHVAWFQERWVLRTGAGRGPIRADGDDLWDSAAVAHDTRWSLPLPTRAETLRYLREVRDSVLDRIRNGAAEELAYFILLSVFHEDMHGEAFTYTRQTLGYPAPPRPEARAVPSEKAPLLEGDVEIPGGTFLLGASREEPFVFDNEKWEHPVVVLPFAMARAPVTQEAFAAFAEDGGYERDELWSEAGRRWREEARASHPVYWRKLPSGRWERRNFDQWIALEPRRPVLHVSWFEAEAYCRWFGRRLPTEAEWELAAAGEPEAASTSSSREPAAGKRRFPWGEELPSPRKANLDALAMGCLDVDALPEGDSAFGLRQMIGNVWEWTASDFLPYPGFVPDPYREYSEPWFGSHKVLRGGCWATRSRLLRNTWRNFYTPDRRDVWAGFRTVRDEA